jgi:plasmid maintenance system antidote protein VapI
LADRRRCPSDQFWMARQASFDLEEARKKLGPRLKQLDRVAA